MPRQVLATPFPNQPLSLPIPKLDESQRASLGQVQSILIDLNLGNRAALDYTLDYWNAMLEMRTRPRDYPWPNAPLSRETEVLTAKGWQRVDSLCIGDVVMTRRDDDGVLEWAPVEATPRVYCQNS